MTLVEQVHERVLEAGAHLGCEACGGDLRPVDRLFVLLADDPDDDSDVTVFAYVCTDCGCLRLHAADLLPDPPPATPGPNMNGHGKP